MTDRQHAILALLQARITPITREGIISELGLQTTCRALQDDIAALQALGHRILSNGEGYRIARTREDVAKCREAAKTRRNHAIAEIRDARRFDQWATELEQIATQGSLL